MVQWVARRSDGEQSGLMESKMVLWEAKSHDEGRDGPMGGKFLSCNSFFNLDILPGKCYPEI